MMTARVWFWLFLHVLVWCFIVFFYFAAPELGRALAVTYLYASVIFPKELQAGGRDWMRSMTLALPAFFIGVFWLCGQRQLSTWLHYSLCLTVYLHAELGIDYE